MPSIKFRGPIRGNPEKAVQTDREPWEYEEYLGFKLEELKGMKVLDLGSGYHETFSKEAAKKGVEVVSLNPMLKEEKFRKSVKEKNPIHKFKNLFSSQKWQKRSVAALAEALPFKEDSFDKVLASFSVPYYTVRTEEEYLKVFSEALRVLKPGGEAIFYPLSEKDFTKNNLGKVIEELKKTSEVLFEEHKIGGDIVDYRLRLSKLVQETPKEFERLNIEEVAEFKGELEEYMEGLKAVLASLEAEFEELKTVSPEWQSFERAKEIQSEIADLKEQIEGLSDSKEAIEEAGKDAIIKIEK